jgi:hypothetical protein
LPADAVLRERIQGVWLLEASFGVINVESYTQMSADGTYFSIGKNRTLGVTKAIFEEGTWTIENGVLRTVASLTLDPAGAPRSSSEITELTDRTWRFAARVGKKLKHGERRKVAAIPEDFVRSMAETRKDLKKPHSLEGTGTAK